MTQKHIGAARGAARAGASGDPKATLQLLAIIQEWHISCSVLIQLSAYFMVNSYNMIHSNFSKFQRNVLTDRGLDIKLPDRGQTAAADQFWRPDRRRQKITRCTSLVLVYQSCWQGSAVGISGACTTDL